MSAVLVGPVPKKTPEASTAPRPAATKVPVLRVIS
jgi:hypothetical protein